LGGQCVPAGEVADVTRQIVTGGDRRRDGRLGIEAVVTATAGQEEGCLTVAEAEVVGEGTQRLEAWTTKLIGLDAADGAVGQPCAWVRSVSPVRAARSSWVSMARRRNRRSSSDN
jgi:hypothetical protein